VSGDPRTRILSAMRDYEQAHPDAVQRFIRDNPDQEGGEREMNTTALDRAEHLPERIDRFPVNPTNPEAVRPRYTLSEMAKIAELLAASGFFPDCKQQSQAFAKILRGAELGLEPATSLAEIQIVQGRPVLSSNLVAALIQRSGRYAYRIRRHDKEACEIEFFEHGESVGTSVFSMEDARRAKLAGKDIWQAYPEAMLFARAISQGGKRFCGAILIGVYVEGEIEPDYPKPVARPAITETAHGPVDRATGEVLPPRTPALSPATPVVDAAALEAQRHHSATVLLRSLLTQARVGDWTAADLDLGLGTTLGSLLAIAEEKQQPFDEIDLAGYDAAELREDGRRLRVRLAELSASTETPSGPPAPDVPTGTHCTACGKSLTKARQTLCQHAGKAPLCVECDEAGKA